MWEEINECMGKYPKLGRVVIGEGEGQKECQRAYFMVHF